METGEQTSRELRAPGDVECLLHDVLAHLRGRLISLLRDAAVTALTEAAYRPVRIALARGSANCAAAGYALQDCAPLSRPCACSCMPNASGLLHKRESWTERASAGKSANRRGDLNRKTAEPSPMNNCLL